MYDCGLYMFHERNYLFQLEVNADTREKKRVKKAYYLQKVLESLARYSLSDFASDKKHEITPKTHKSISNSISIKRYFDLVVSKT